MHGAHEEVTDNCKNIEKNHTLEHPMEKTKQTIKTRCRSQSPISSDKGTLFGSSQSSKSLDSVEIPLQLCEKDSDELKHIDSIDETNMNFNYNRDLWQKRVNLHNYNYAGNTNKLTSTTRNWLQKHTPDLVMDLPLENNYNSSNKTLKPALLPDKILSDVSPKEEQCASTLNSPTGPESPDMSTAAERFAKQNQSTLKKNTKIHSKGTNNTKENLNEDKMNLELETVDSSTSNPTQVVNATPVDTNKDAPNVLNKPHIKAKPQGLKKSFLYFSPPVPPEVMQKDNSDSYMPMQ